MFKAAERALTKGYSREPVLVGCGGSIGFVEPFAKAFGVLHATKQNNGVSNFFTGGAPAILVGVEDPYTSAHGENESLLLSDFKKSILSIMHLFYELHK